MNNFEFKVGDRVIASDNVGEYEMRPGTIVGLWFHANHPFPYSVKFDEGRCLTLWSKVHSIINSEKKIVITTDGVKITTATLYEDGKKVKTATAKCCPEDTFDFMVGAKLACERLSPKKEETEWRVVKRPVKVGDYICLTEEVYSFDTVGDILKVSKVSRNGLATVYAKDHPKDTRQIGEFPWNYLEDSYVVIEKVTKTTEPPKPKYYNGKVVCVSNSINDGEFTVGKVYEIVDGKFTDNKNKTRPTCSDRVIDLDDLDHGIYFGDWFYKFIPFVED